MNQCEAARAAQQVIRMQTALIKTFLSPDGHHRALRSIYSPRGVCEVYPKGEHSPLCPELWTALEMAADWWDAHGERETEQLLLLDGVAI